MKRCPDWFRQRPQALLSAIGAITLYTLAHAAFITYDAPEGGSEPDHYVRDIRFENVVRFGEATTATSSEVQIPGAVNGATVAALGLRLMNVTREGAHVNSLGMEFVPAGTSNLLVSRWETRVQDFAAFVKATGYDTLSEASRIAFTDTPKWKCTGAFRDLHPRIAPVGNYTSNGFGLFDMGGNVWEWCSTWYQTNLNQADLSDSTMVQGILALLDDGGGCQNRVVQGGAWHVQRQVDLRTRFRGIGDPRTRFDDFGFRCVLARDDATISEWHAAPGTKTPARREGLQNL